MLKSVWMKTFIQEGLKLCRNTSISVRKINLHCTTCQMKNRPPGGGRTLTDESRVFEYDDWDNVEWGEEQEDDARKKVDENSSKAVPEEMREKYESEAGSFWDQFYNQHQNRFFKDRHWLFTEFPELAPADYVPPEKEERPGSSQPSSSANPPEPSSSSKTLADNQRVLVQGIQGEPEEFSPEKAKRALEEAMASAGLSDQDKKERVCQGIQGPIPGEPVSKAADTFPGEKSTMRLFEVGCGVGNTVFPVLETNNDPNLFVYCCDLSDTAIQLVKEHSEYRNGERCHAFVADVTELDQPFPFPKQSLDIVILIFVLSAIHPDKMQATISRLAEYLKPGGMIVFRDYGRYDLAQLRFKNGKCLSPNFYVRGDGTRVYFFTQEELRTLFCSAGLTEEVQNHVDRRLQVNRGRQLKMYRVWVQCKYRKPANSGANS